MGSWASALVTAIDACMPASPFYLSPLHHRSSAAVAGDQRRGGGGFRRPAAAGGEFRRPAVAADSGGRRRIQATIGGGRFRRSEADSGDWRWPTADSGDPQQLQIPVPGSVRRRQLAVPVADSGNRWRRQILATGGYDDWKIMMEAHLYALHDCMWMPKEKWDDRDCKKHNLDNVAKAAIFKTLDPITFSKIKHLKTAMEIWQGLGKLCEGSEDLRKQKIEVLLEKFKSFKMLPGESFDMLDKRFHKILNDLASLNHILSPKEKNVRLLRSLPTEWYTKATAMEEGRNLENYTVQGLLDALRTYEQELKKKKEEQVTPFPTALMTTPRVPSSEGTCPRNCDTPSSSQPSSSKMENYDEEFAMMVKQFRKFKKFFKKADSVRRPSKGKPQVSDSPPESYLCYNCRKPGHWKSACSYPKVEKYGERERNDKKKKAMVAAESDESSSSSSDKEALVCMERRAEKSNHEDRWTMSEDDTLCLMAKENADQEFKKMMEDCEEINLKHSSLIEENKLLSEENLMLTEGRKSQLSDITQLKAENESLSKKVKSLNKELGILKSKEAVDKLLETTKHKGREGLGFDPSSSKRKGRTTFIPRKPTAKPNKQKGKEKEKPTEVPKKDMASLKNISTNEVILTGKRIRNIYEVMWDDVKEACLISKVGKPSKHDHEVLDLSDKDEEVNEEDRMKSTEFIPFRSLPLKTSQRNPDLDSAEPTGNHGQPSIISDHSNGDNSGSGDPVPIHPESPTNSVLQPEAELDQPVNPNQHNLRWLRDHPPQQVIGDIQSSKLEAKCSSPAFYQSYLEMIAAQELTEFLHMEIHSKYEGEVLEFYRNGKVKIVQSKKNPQRTLQIIKSTVGGAKVKISQKKLDEKLHLPNSGSEIGRLLAKNLDWKTIGISGQIPSGPAKKADLNNDYKLVLELVIACLECGSGGHANDITQERAFIINALITKSKVNWAAHFFNSISKHLGKPKQKYLCQGLYLGYILESMGVASKGKKYDAKYWLYYLSFKGENRAGTSATAEESSSDNVLIMSLKKSVKRKQVVSPSPSAKAPQNLALLNLEEEEEVSTQGKLQRKKKTKITSPSTSGNANPDELVGKEPVEEISAHNQSPQQLDEEIPQVHSFPTPSSQAQIDDAENQFWQLYYDWRAWKVGNSAEQLLGWDQQLKNEKIIKRCLGLPVNYCCEQILDVDWPIFSKATEDQMALTTKAQADMEATAEDFQIFPETSPAFETVLPEAFQENAASPQREQHQEASEEELHQLLQSQVQEILTTPCERSSAEAEKEAQIDGLETSETPVAIFEQNIGDEDRDSLSRDISKFMNETEEESEKTLRIDDEGAEQGYAESLPLQLFHRAPPSHQVTNFHFHSSSNSTLPDEVPETWTRKVQGLIESALASQHASFRQEIEKMEARYNKLMEKTEEKHCSDLKEISTSVDKTLEIISLLSDSVSTTMEAYASHCHLQLKEVNKIKEQIATVIVSLQKQMSFLQMDFRSALAVSSANQVVTKDYLKVILENQKEAFRLFRHFGTHTGNPKLEVIVQHNSPSLIPELPIEVKQGELTYIPSHLKMTDLILEAQRSNPENLAQHLSSSSLDGTEAVGTIASHFSNDAHTKERYHNLRRIREQCGNMQGIGEIVGSS
ncbi:unnamed protein product [Cuscuta campestris]|uniref:CCHC-type domain-containing protein n=1 Tax=Cuscuta campestris TaxID=132261 RepID=A0A484M4H3_9ASTE|nr:unnamed protein product [Cuscuta campestris]